MADCEAQVAALPYDGAAAAELERTVEIEKAAVRSAGERVDVLSSQLAGAWYPSLDVTACMYTSVQHSKSTFSEIATLSNLLRIYPRVCHGTTMSVSRESEWGAQMGSCTESEMWASVRRVTLRVSSRPAEIVES